MAQRRNSPSFNQTTKVGLFTVIWRFLTITLEADARLISLRHLSFWIEVREFTFHVQLSPSVLAEP